MKKTSMNMQRGSAHVIIIICLVVALIGALGWIFYQNFITNGSDQKGTQVAARTQDDADATQKEKVAKTYNLVINQWRVGADYNNSEVGDIEYKITSYDEAEVASFTSNKLRNGEKCSYGAAGLISRYPAAGKMTRPFTDENISVKSFFEGGSGDERVTNWKKVGEYYYWYQSPQGLCGEDEKGKSLQLATSEEIKNLISALEAL